MLAQTEAEIIRQAVIERTAVALANAYCTAYLNFEKLKYIVNLMSQIVDSQQFKDYVAELKGYIAYPNGELTKYILWWSQNYTIGINKLVNYFIPLSTAARGIVSGLTTAASTYATICPTSKRARMLNTAANRINTDLNNAMTYLNEYKAYEAMTALTDAAQIIYPATVVFYYTASPTCLNTSDIRIGSTIPLSLYACATRYPDNTFTACFISSKTGTVGNVVNVTMVTPPPSGDCYLFIREAFGEVILNRTLAVPPENAIVRVTCPLRCPPNWSVIHNNIINFLNVYNTMRNIYLNDVKPWEDRLTIATILMRNMVLSLQRDLLSPLITLQNAMGTNTLAGSMIAYCIRLAQIQLSSYGNVLNTLDFRTSPQTSLPTISRYIDLIVDSLNIATECIQNKLPIIERGVNAYLNALSSKLRGLGVTDIQTFAQTHNIACTFTPQAIVLNTTSVLQVYLSMFSPTSFVKTVEQAVKSGVNVLPTLTDIKCG